MGKVYATGQAATGQACEIAEMQMQEATDVAVGAVIMSKASGKILLGRRSDIVEMPNVLGIFGGRKDDYESGEEALEREVLEEVGYPLFGYKERIAQYYDPARQFLYETYIALVDNDFEVQLNDEHTEAVWLTLAEVDNIAPCDIHPALKATLDNQAVHEHIGRFAVHWSQDNEQKQENSWENSF